MSEQNYVIAKSARDLLGWKAVRAAGDGLDGANDGVLAARDRVMRVKGAGEQILASNLPQYVLSRNGKRAQLAVKDLVAAEEAAATARGRLASAKRSAVLRTGTAAGVTGGTVGTGGYLVHRNRHKK